MERWETLPSIRHLDKPTSPTKWISVLKERREHVYFHVRATMCEELRGQSWGSIVTSNLV